MNRLHIRKKAMESMLREPPSSPLRRRAKEPLPTEDKYVDDKTDEAGYVSMMVSPEEKQMLLDMREGKGGPGSMVEVEQEIVE